MRMYSSNFFLFDVDFRGRWSASINIGGCQTTLRVSPQGRSGHFGSAPPPSSVCLIPQGGVGVWGGEGYGAGGGGALGGRTHLLPRVCSSCTSSSSPWEIRPRRGLSPLIQAVCHPPVGVRFGWETAEGSERYPHSGGTAHYNGVRHCGVQYIVVCF